MIKRTPLRTLATVTAFRTRTYIRAFHAETKVIPQAHYNVVFDIDGVLIKGKQVLPQTHRALSLLKANNVPYIFLTNGGGLKETDKAAQLSKKIGAHIAPEQLILSHSPMRALAQKYEHKNVLVVGGNGSDCRQVAEYYGLKHVVTPEEVHVAFPYVCPSSAIEAREIPLPEKYLQNVNRPVEAIMVFHDSVDWGRDLQVMLDALVSVDGYLNTVKSQAELHTTKQSVPLYFSNSDLVWSNEHPNPRFAQGTFRTCLERIYQDMTGHKLEYTLFGKPMRPTYQYAESVLNNLAPIHIGPNGMPKPRTVYAIGDNPYADIAGANAYGWKSVLVRTGVFKPEGDENHHIHPATTVVDDVEDAVRWIISTEIRKEHPF
ncbi:HAD-like domain-containing protein [Gamsiella multidivaricata]|uniref:HAD-like domain-containing protein n=1 Tax=Gamsiella multidivaricata TaxID=101098 RepID=UPI002221193C|nr:HAD-like domain-containing protein [Gamsiella multidivaricata]KAI7816612.1 HAD-like domain-containing protein [Gamsiella multidivaricata]